MKQTLLGQKSDDLESKIGDSVDDDGSLSYHDNETTQVAAAAMVNVNTADDTTREQWLAYFQLLFVASSTFCVS